MMAPMTVAESPDASDKGEAPAWAWPLQALVAWLAARPLTIRR